MGECPEAQRPDTAEALQAAFDNDALFEKIIEVFPYPMQVFSPDGTALRINRTAQDVLGINSENHVGKYNVFRDPIVREQGIMDRVKQVLSGETVVIKDLTAPYQDMIKYFNVADQDTQSLFLDITCFPLLKPDKTVGCFIAVFLIKKIYRHRDEIQKAKEYIETHWQEKYDADKTAKAANLSRYHFSQLFKKHVGVTPHNYYISVKIRNLQESLRDESLTVSEAFSQCGVDYHGHFVQVFKKKVGLSPTEYRALASRGKHNKK